MDGWICYAEDTWVLKWITKMLMTFYDAEMLTKDFLVKSPERWISIYMLDLALVDETLITEAATEIVHFSIVFNAYISQ